MTKTFRLTLAQLNPTLGDLAGNAAKALAAWQAGRAAGADMVALPEMFLTGYQTQDLVLKPAFVRDAMAEMQALAAKIVDGPALGIGGPFWNDQGQFNAWWVLRDGAVLTRLLKHHLPHDDVFDEMRLFEAGPISGPYRIGPLTIGSPVCEDAWHPDVAETLAETGAEILLVPNGSPYRRGKLDLRMNVTVARVVETGLPLVYLNMVGGQDDQLFVKVNGQIMEAMDYKGNNSFEGGLGRVKATFEFPGNGAVKVKASYMTEPDKYVTIEGDKMLKYPG